MFQSLKQNSLDCRIQVFRIVMVFKQLNRVDNQQLCNRKF